MKKSILACIVSCLVALPAAAQEEKTSCLDQVAIHQFATTAQSDMLSLLRNIEQRGDELEPHVSMIQAMARLPREAMAKYKDHEVKAGSWWQDHAIAISKWADTLALPFGTLRSYRGKITTAWKKVATEYTVTLTKHPCS